MSKCNDQWTSKDKALHFGVCFVLASINPIVAVVVAVAKEAYDMKQNGNHWCWKDMVADAVGVALGTVVHLLIHLLVL